ncbi:MAG TPA: sigma-54 dependent transcriptional regulator [Candidatus Hydrogenedentes bacterium]|nr:sigma-54 dependent transcriptional regulator [Candidatus Hydrogenedentota bacterium]HQE82600.1 sigma-54 dependent transcriptional regulator [Candidatus Hydrogenedentota bacterium]HQH51516.1 sigma-54 dependent transcriptional regulator [Candidatus Hydrogenedentota bacterium]HQM50357.1 sigma-54 dependent transcriptional regulator [Candidatus Hydrogenedentota bacterium]
MQTILAIDDEPSVRASYDLILSGSYRVIQAEDGKTALRLLDTNHVDLIILDLIMPGLPGMEVLEQITARSIRTPVVVVTAHKGVDTAVKAMKRGARDYILKPFDVDELTIIVQRALTERRHEEALNVLREDGVRGFEAIVGDSPALTHTLELARKAMRVDSTVLITGESGTGKDLLARCIHSGGPRAAEAFVPVSCCAIPEHLVESELFGHERGAFTGAFEHRTGKVQVADGGTLFLDEIGEMPLEAQGKLLRVLQDGQFYPVGSSKAIGTDVRFICATNRNLLERIKQGGFREDLYYRINVIPIEMPPLRRRREDIPLLVAHFLQKHAPRVNARATRFTADALAQLASHEWPGNVRELENAIERVLVHHSDKTAIDVTHLEGLAHIQEPGASGGIAEFEGLSIDEATARLERHLILRALERSNYVQSRAAEILGTTRRVLKYKMDNLGIEPPPE